MASYYPELVSATVVFRSDVFCAVPELWRLVLAGFGFQFLVNRSSFALTGFACRYCEGHFAGRSATILRGLRSHRLTNQWNGKLTWSCGWLRQSSAPGQFPLISDVRRRREMVPKRTNIVSAVSQLAFQ